jgi:protein-S-isoprenylcysteine O-methyltransferase Ste14
MTRRPSLTRWTVPALFALAAASIGADTERDFAHALTQQGTRSWLVVVYGLLRTCVFLAFAVFTIGRSAPRRRARNPLAYLACAAAMATALAFSGPSHNTPEGALLAGDIVTLAFCAWLLASVLFLGRCFGVLPEARGLVTSGPYRLIRHPVYLGEIGACAGLALAAPSAGNAAVLAAVIVAQSIRMRMEERALTQAFPEYAAYAADTPRLIPRISLPRLTGMRAHGRRPVDSAAIGEPLHASLAEPVSRP